MRFVAGGEEGWGCGEPEVVAVGSADLGTPSHVAPLACLGSRPLAAAECSVKRCSGVANACHVR